LYELADMTDGPAPLTGWAPLVYFWDGGWIGVGASGGKVPPHAHHAIQICLGLDGPLRLRLAEGEGGEWKEVAGGVVLPDVPHAFDGQSSTVAMIFIDPECAEGRWLRDSTDAPILALSREAYAQHVPELMAFRDRRPSVAEAARIISGVVRSLCAGPPPLKKVDTRITQALEAIRRADVRKMSLEDAAKSVFLSPSRFAHLFKDEVGLPFRRYLLWRKLSRAMEEFGRGANLTNAAHAAGFSDSAHLTHTWRQMFGVSPTAMLGAARFYEIPAPFELADSAPES
jgi:AraC family transcriptional regulator